MSAVLTGLFTVVLAGGPSVVAAQSVSGAKSGANTAPGASGADNGASGQNAPAQAPMLLPGTAQAAAAAKGASPSANATANGASGANGGGAGIGNGTSGRQSSGLTPVTPLLRAPPGLSGAYGIVVDSIHGGVLVGAVVTISGTTRQGISDSTGKFRIDSIPPGTYQMALFHPLLDSIGVAIGTNPVEFPAGRYALVAIGTPSGPTLVTSFCPPEKRITGNGLILGRVTDADTDDPATGAKVSFTWTQLDVGKDIGVRHIPRTREATVDAGGSYHICGVPERQSGTLRATTPTFTTADLPLDFTSGLVQIMMLHVSKPDTVTPPPAPTVVVADTTKKAPGKTPAEAPAAPVKRVVALRTGRATLTGAIYNSAAHGIPGVDVTVVGAASTATTDSTGHFTLHNLPSGTQTLTLRKVGYAQKDLPVDISATVSQNKIIRLDQAAPVLAKVTVTAKWEQELKKIGFTDRAKTGLGRYQTREEIEAKLPTYITDVFQSTPGITVDYGSGHPVLKSSRDASGGCVAYVIDGIPYTEQSPGDINDYMRPSEIEATEVYNASETPAEYQKAGSTSCTTILIWTKTRVGDFR